MKSLNTIADQLLLIRKKTEKANDEYKTLKIKEKYLRDDMLAAMGRDETRSVKRRGYEIGISRRYVVDIWNEEKLKRAIKKRKLKHCVEEKITQYFRTSVAGKLARQGITLDGTQVDQVESLVIFKGGRPKFENGYPKSFSKAAIGRMLKDGGAL